MRWLRQEGVQLSLDSNTGRVEKVPDSRRKSSEWLPPRSEVREDGLYLYLQVNFDQSTSNAIPSFAPHYSIIMNALARLAWLSFFIWFCDRDHILTTALSPRPSFTPREASRHHRRNSVSLIDRESSLGSTFEKSGPQALKIIADEKPELQDGSHDEIGPATNLDRDGSSIGTKEMSEREFQPVIETDLDHACLPSPVIGPKDDEGPDFEAPLHESHGRGSLRRRSRFEDWRQRVKARLMTPACNGQREKKKGSVEMVRNRLLRRWKAMKMFLVSQLIRFAVWLEVPWAKLASFGFKFFH